MGLDSVIYEYRLSGKLNRKKIVQMKIGWALQKKRSKRGHYSKKKSKECEKMSKRKNENERKKIHKIHAFLVHFSVFFRAVVQSPMGS